MEFVMKIYLHSYHTSSPNFFGGSSDENEKVLGTFLARLCRAKKGVPKFFASGSLSFVVEALKTVKKPLKQCPVSQKSSSLNCISEAQK